MRKSKGLKKSILQNDPSNPSSSSAPCPPLLLGLTCSAAKLMNTNWAAVHFKCTPLPRQHWGLHCTNFECTEKCTVQNTTMDSLPYEPSSKLASLEMCTGLLPQSAQYLTSKRVVGGCLSVRASALFHQGKKSIKPYKHKAGGSQASTHKAESPQIFESPIFTREDVAKGCGFLSLEKHWWLINKQQYNKGNAEDHSVQPIRLCLLVPAFR